MFQRKIEKELEAWYKSLSFKRKALLVKGARQVGKTTAIDEFLKARFKEILYIDFKANIVARDGFIVSSKCLSTT